MTKKISESAKMNNKDMLNAAMFHSVAVGSRYREVIEDVPVYKSISLALLASQVKFSRQLLKLENRLRKILGQDPVKLRGQGWAVPKKDPKRRGGGTRFSFEELVKSGPEAGMTIDSRLFNGCSVNYSSVAGKAVRAEALSAIIHPEAAMIPSLHLHVSLSQPNGTEQLQERKRRGLGVASLRMIADLNPSKTISEDVSTFNLAAVDALSESELVRARGNGDRYFNIPFASRRRGACHVFSETGVDPEEMTEDQVADLVADVLRFTDAMTSAYLKIVSRHLDKLEERYARASGFAAEQKAMQLVFGDDFQREYQDCYNSLYILQVLLLDRGTSQGLMAHNYNDLGVLASLPSRYSLSSILSLCKKMRGRQRSLANKIERYLSESRVPGRLGKADRLALAKIVRDFYRQNPGAMSLQAPVPLPVKREGA